MITFNKHTAENQFPRLAKVRKKIAVWSGKGGVGKTFFSIQLAFAIKRFSGSEVALFDADIDCPNITQMLGITEKHLADQASKSVYPVHKDGLRVVSMGALFEKEDDTVIWRGPMISHAITSFLETVEWGAEYIVADLPPGTSDAPLTIAQQFKPDAFIIVSSPDKIAALDAKRSINFARKLSIPVIGVIENMSGDVFGSGGAEDMAKDAGVRFLGRILLSAKARDSISLNKPLCDDQEFRGMFHTVYELIK